MKIIKTITGRRERAYRPLSWPMQAVTWLVIVTQALLAVNRVFAVEAVSVSLPSNAPASTKQPPARPEPVLTPETVKVNRSVPKVSPPSGELNFSATPTDAEIMQARVFGEPLIPMGQTNPSENRELAQALIAFSQRSDADDLETISRFLKDHPASAWRVSLLTYLGIVHRHTGRFTKALACWEEAWALGKNVTEPKGRAVADRAVAELLELNARLGRFERLEVLFAEIEGRNLDTSVSEKISGARSGLWLMRNQPQDAFRCGPMALAQIVPKAGMTADFFEKIHTSRSTLLGISLTDVCHLANELGMDYQMARRKPGSQVVVPAVVHWKLGHYAALVAEQDGRYLVKDPTFGNELWISRAVLEEEVSGNFLVPKGNLSAGWEPISPEEGQKVWGKGNTQVRDNSRTREDDKKKCPKQGGNPMAEFSVHLMTVSLNLVDTPVGYSPPRGPSVFFRVTYNQREAGQPTTFTYANLGPKWTFNWMSFITDNPAAPLNSADCYLPGGGFETYTGFNTNTQSYLAQPDNFAILTRTSTNSYERKLPDGTRQIFSVSDGVTTFPRRIFLSQIIDPAGNAVTLTYDGSLRLLAITDALGQVTTNSYDFPGDSLKITKVTDPFGRYATFQYNGSGQLTNITDILGITSGFTYTATNNHFITALTTPYGRTKFAYGESGMTRWIEATDSYGEKERVEYVHDAIASTDSPVPAVLPPLMNSYLQYRNTFYWNKKAMQTFPGDYSKAELTHWLHAANTDVNTCSGVVESTKNPLEVRVWRTYPGQTSSIQVGTNDSPSAIARVLDDGTSQIYRYEYNALGKPTKITDPTNRVTLFAYATNMVDLLQVAQLAGSSTQILGSFTYNSAHLPLTTVDAAGQTNYFGYNANGQLKALTNALGETVSMIYNPDGYLTNITGSLPGSTTSFTYDGYGRVRTVTDSEGFTVTTDYDAADRPTKVTYPDNTYDQTVYDRLDPVLSRDRRGHWACSVFDALRRLVDTYDAGGRHTHLEWCGCGALESITDPLDRTTTWLRDLQGRVTTKIYPDATQVLHGYETNSSRLKSVTDAKNQTTLYQYFIDNNVKQVSYSNAVVATPTVSFTYDTNYNRLLTLTDGIGTTSYGYLAVTNAQLGAGQLASVDGPLTNDTITYTYDVLGRVKSRAIDGVAQAVTYDALGRVTVVTNALGTFSNAYVGVTGRISTNAYPNGQKTVFSYYGSTNDFRLQQIQNSTLTSNLSTFAYTYDADGQIATWTQQADVQTPQVWVTEYDPVDQLLGVTVRSNTVAGAILKRYAYGYDKAGNRRSETVETSSASSATSTTHNNLNQLTSVAGGGQTRFKGSLDELGTVTVGGSAAPLDSRTTNFTGFATTTTGTNTVPVIATDYSGNARTNNYQLVVTNNGVAKTLLYDLNGNLTNAVTATTTNSYEWDAEDRMVAINSGTNRSEFSYDGLNRLVRIVEKTNGVAQSTNWFVWCGTERCEERNNTGGTVTKRFFDQGQINYQPSTITLFYTTDHLGSVREMTDGTGAVRARYDYDPYGRMTQVAGDLASDFRYTGHYYHTKSGLYLAPLRAYDADSGRWLSRDPIQEEGGLNLYAYVENDPVNASDPLGLYPSSLNTPTGAAVMAWAMEGAAVGMATGVVGELARQAGAYAGGDCDAWDSSNVAKEGLKGAAWGAAMGPIFGRAFQAISPYLRALMGNAGRIVLDRTMSVIGKIKPGNPNIYVNPNAIRYFAELHSRSIGRELGSTVYHEAFHHTLVPLDRAVGKLLGVRDIYTASKVAFERGVGKGRWYRSEEWAANAYGEVRSYLRTRFGIK